MFFYFFYEKNAGMIVAFSIFISSAVQASSAKQAREIGHIITYGNDTFAQEALSINKLVGVDKNMLTHPNRSKEILLLRDHQAHLFFQGTDTALRAYDFSCYISVSEAQQNPGNLDYMVAALKSSIRYLGAVQDHFYEKIVVDLQKKLGHINVMELDLVGTDVSLVRKHAEMATRMLQTFFVFSETSRMLALWLRSLIKPYFWGFTGRFSIIKKLNQTTQGKSIINTIRELCKLIEQFNSDLIDGDYYYFDNNYFGLELGEVACDVLDYLDEEVIVEHIDEV